MNRRTWLRSSFLGSAALGLPGFGLQAAAQEPPAVAASRSGEPPLRITDVQTTLTAPAGIRLVVVKVVTNEPGLYGLGCATFTQRARAVETAIDKFLKPFLITHP